MIFVAHHAVLLIAACLCVAGAGTLVAPRDAIAVRCAIGTTVWAHMLFLAALIGQLRVVPVVVLALIAIAGLWRNRAIPRDVPPIMVVFFALLFVVALRPPLGFDETLYHLPTIQALAESGALQYRPELRFPVFPQLQELLCVPLFLAGGDVAAHLVSLIEVAIITALLFHWGRGVSSRRAGLLAAALFAGSPIIVHLGTITYVDAALALFVAAGFYCLDQRRFALAGFFLGTACSVKYLGGFFAVVALVVIILIREWRGAAKFVACCTAAALPTTLWLTLWTRDPLFPFLRDSIWTLNPASAPIGVHVERILRVAWDVTFARDRVNTQPHFTPLFIAMLIVVILAARRDARARAVALIAIAWVIVFSFLPQDSRYLVSLLPLISAVSAIYASRFVRNANWSSFVALSPAIAYAIFVLAVRGLPPVTPESRERLLTDRVPGYAALARAGRESVYNCGAEQLKGYARGRFLGDFAGPYSYDRILSRSRTTASIATSLRRIGVQNFLAVNRACAPVSNDGGMDLVYEDGSSQLWRVRQDNSVR